MNNTYLTDLRKVSDYKYKNIPELSLISECVSSNILIQN